MEDLRGVAVELQRVPLRSQVVVNRAWPRIAEGVFDGSAHARSAHRLLDDLVRWAAAVRVARSASTDR